MNKARRKELLAAIDLIVKIKDDYEALKQIITTAAEGEREYYDNMSENLQGGDKGQAADAAATELEEAQQSLEELDLDDLISKIDNAKGES